MAPVWFIHGDAQSLPLAGGSVQCVITSPPYWGLRDYGIPPSAWGGNPQCAHEWGGEAVKPDTRGPGKCRLDSPGEGVNMRFDRNLGAFCSRCGAWRGCLGLEPTPDLFVAHVVEIFREVRRVLRDDGTVWLNLGDSYSSGGRGNYDVKSSNKGNGASRGLGRPAPDGYKPKNLIGIPWRVAFALQADGWYLRDCIIWAKPNPMPSSVTDRTTTAHEYVFLLTKKARYYYDADAIREPVTSTGGASVGKQNHDAGGTGAQSRRFASPEERNNPLGRNKRSVWTISTQSCKEAHFATYPMRLVEPCILAGTSEKGCCPHCGAPWRRVVERVPTEHRQKMADGWATGEGSHGMIHCDGREKGEPDVPVMARVTIHWLPSCKCPAHEPVPCLILDPFNGAATTGLVAWKHGRSYVGVERKPEYIEISRRRLAAYQEKHKDGFKVKPTRAPKAEPEEPSLFGAPA